MKHFTKGTIVINLTAEVAVVVGTRNGDPVLQQVNRDGRRSGGKWVADQNRCEAFATVEEAYRIAWIRSDLQREQLRAVADRERMDRFLESERSAAVPRWPRSERVA